MDRRKFLGLAGGAAVVAVVPIPKVEAEIVGFGLAPVKGEGAIVAYDGFAKNLWPGINEWFTEQYLNYNPEHIEIFNPDP